MEAAQRAREASRPGGGGPPRGGDAFRRADARPPEPTGPPGAPPGAQRPRPPSQSPSREARPPLGQDEQRPPRDLRADAPPPGAPRPQPPQIPMRMPSCRHRRLAATAPAVAPTNGGPPPQPPGMRGFRDIAADADDLGRAAAQANRAAEKPMPTCRRPRRNSTGSSRTWKTAAPIPTRLIRIQSMEEADVRAAASAAAAAVA